MIRFLCTVFIIATANFGFLYGQLSPGDLADPHAHLEGMSNCTKCHVLGKKVSGEKCLECHSHLNERITNNKGYHASSEVRGKECTQCHSDHHGRNFEMIRFDKESFDHSLTGYELEGAHNRQQCSDCHRSEYIRNSEIRKKNRTYLGLGTECLSCHEDYHQGTLETDCFSCHDYKTFQPAPKFDHNRSNFPLKGKHQEVKCAGCHKTISSQGKEMVQFRGIAHESCVQCHEDVHDNRFGKNCVSCHSEVSFHVIRELSAFDHDRTGYPLEGKHRYVSCEDCHKNSYTEPLPHSLCKDCHTDYHQGEFRKPEGTPDCNDCHSLDGFEGSLFNVERHNEQSFKLQGAHLATPCFACHKKQERWRFRDIGMRCIDCHDNIHDPYLDKRFYPEASCESCHGERRWSDITFDHSRTNFKLQGAHRRQTCRSCHFKTGPGGNIEQQFSGIGGDCIACHKDVHFRQFDEEDETVCTRCHTFENWSPDKFNHDQTRFALDGAHRDVACKECHLPVQRSGNTFVLYKLEKLRCEDCHK